MPGDPVIELGALGIGKRSRVGFQAFPHRIQQLCLLRRGKAVELVAQIAHAP